MAKFGFGVRSQVADWQARGVIDERLSQILNADLDEQKSSYSFSSIAVILGVICLCFGAMTFVAANWDEMSRLLRLVVLLSSTGLSYIIASLFQGRGREFFAQCFVLLGSGCFGATVMLVGQMYHLPGHGSGAIMIWSLGTLAAAALTRSLPTLGLATILATIWSCWLMGDYRGHEGIHFWYLLLWGACAGLAWHFGSRFVAHLCALGLQAWLVFSFAEIGSDFDWPLFAMFSVSTSLLMISLLIYSKDMKNWLRGFEMSAIFHFVLFSMMMLVLWYSEQYSYSFKGGANFTDWLTSKGLIIGLVYLGALVAGGLGILRVANTVSKFDHLMTIVLSGLTIAAFALSISAIPFALEAFSLVFTIWVIRMGTRQEGVGITRLGYVGFIGVMLLIYGEAAGGLLGTSFFYIIAGVLLVAGAVIAPRISGKKELAQ